MRLIIRNDIERWAEQFNAKGYFPVLISRLVRATAPKDAHIDFPSGNAVFVGGWDGFVQSPLGDSYVPEGVSLWELGTESGSKGKADDDYKKRTENPEGYICADCTFIFVTPHFWKLKDKWRQAKLSEGKWKDIRVYDSSTLEQWLDDCAVVSRWFSALISKYPSDGIVTIEEYWREWSLGPMGYLPPEAITSGRQLEIETLLNFLNGQPGIKAIRAASKDEATAFILAASKSFNEHLKERFAARTLIIDTSGNFRSIRINVKSLNLIARFEDPQGLYTAAADGHHVLVPLGPNDNLNQDTTELPTIDRDGQIKSLVQMGLTETDAERFSREAGRDITILKRLLRFPQNRLPWLSSQYVRQLIPAMLIGRWHAQKKGDHLLLEYLANQAYEQYLPQVTEFITAEEAPILKIGELYRLLSPLDTWATLAEYITLQDLNALGHCFHQAFASGNPLAVPAREEDRWIIEFNKEKTYSSWAREGLVQSLILVGLYGDKLKLTGIGDAQRWVDSLLETLLEGADGALWISLNNEMPLLAEAAPEPFLAALNAALTVENSPVMQMFLEEEGFLHKSSYHTGLLWALESLAWLPEYLPEAAIILARLSQLDPGGQLANRPFNSLVGIFKTWYYQTLASFEERTDVIHHICQNEPDIGWKLLIHLLPESHSTAHPSHKMRWRVFDRNFNINYSYGEIWNMNSFAVDMLISLFDGSDAKLAELLDKSVELSEADRKKVLECALLNASLLKENYLKTWNEVRSILSLHRSYPDNDWALPAETLEDYQRLYDLLTPKELIDQQRWLFDDWPNFPEGGDTDERKDEKIKRRRKEAVQAIIQKYGLPEIISLSTKVKEPWSLGAALAEVLVDENQVRSLLTLTDFDDASQLKFVKSFLAFQNWNKDISWVKRFYDFLLSTKVAVKVLIDFLTSMEASAALWDMLEELPVDIQDGYWQQMSPWFFKSTTEEKLRGLENLIKYQRFFTAINQADFIIDDIPSDFLSNLLEKTAMTEAKEPGRLDHHLEHLLDVMEDREDINHEQKIKLEWLYMPILGGYHARRRPENLHAELARNPKFFVEVLTWLYRPKSNRQLQENTEGYTTDMIVNRAESAHKLLNSWRTVPGSINNDDIDGIYLVNWVNEVRVLAIEVDRAEVADAQIGLILGRYPERENDWPPLPICKLIEELNNEVINRNFITQVFNNHGSSSRGPFDGGNIERRLAERFNRFADGHKNKHRKLSRLFRDLAKRYLQQAKIRDEEAERDRLEY